MTVNKNDIEKYQEIYKKIYGEKIDVNKANNELKALIILLKIILQFNK